MRTYRIRTTALAAATAGLALALTACGGSDTAGGAATKPGASKGADQPASSPAGEGGSSAPAAGKGTGSGTGTPAKAGSGTGSGSGSGAKGTGDTVDDSYAYTHPCSAKNLTVKVTSQQGLPATVRVITVTNNGSTTCGLDYFPTVGFSAKGATLGVQATAPEGLGGAPAYPMRPGATAYAALDLNPSAGDGPVADEVSILADREHMPNADGVSLPLAKPGSVVKPKIGLYRTGARESLSTI
ncbi:DUF4232 domain-containing protein [Streptomyces sp. ISL-86]|uniref:DUF4232 domain-containing protein n=1 Tax=Streptomyces sp. ISL-86 TaxID=2819187 RepID=UPI001BE8B7C9|nr:DUF4232 domain-containing protein [Streptomyces sp. ISL-86]MBT2457692.1 DUF4232 domain-containing protein [Streptomyces sp. ISL-86]